MHTIQFNSICHSCKLNLMNKFINFRQIGFYGIFSISASFYVLALIYGIFFVDEPAMIVNEKDKLKAKEKGLLADFFDKEHVIETFKVAFKKGENQRRLRVTMILIVVMVVIGPMHGEMSVIYLFTRYKFNWSEVEFSFFSTYAMLTSLVGRFTENFDLTKVIILVLFQEPFSQSVSSHISYKLMTQSSVFCPQCPKLFQVSYTHLLQQHGNYIWLLLLRF